MDTTTVQVVQGFVIWLWPLWKSGAEAFGDQVGKGLGEDFVKAMRRVASSLPLHRSPKEEDIRQLDPDIVKSISQEGKPALRRLLRDPDFYTIPDLVVLIGDLGYAMEQQVIVVDRFVNQAWADSKSDQLQAAVVRHLEQPLEDTNPRAFKRLLRNPHSCPADDLRRIIGDLDYTLEQFKPIMVTQVSLAHRFVDQAWADGKATDLIEAIQLQKPNLFYEG